MILEHQHFDLAGRAILERYVFRTPLQVAGSMQQEACFILPVHGQVESFNAASRHRVESGAGMLLRCGNYLNRWVGPAPGKHVETFIVRLYPDVLRELFHRQPPPLLRPARAAHNLLGRRIAPGELLHAFTESLRFYFTHPQLVTPELTELKLRELLLLLLKIDPEGGTGQLLASLFDPVAFTSRQVVDQHLYDNLRLQDFAKLCNLSLSSFKRRFGELTGVAPGTYIRRQRLARAARMLQRTQTPIGEIAESCGYENQGYFSKIFREAYGMPPRAYRRSTGR